MKEKDYYKRWLIPQKGVNRDTAYKNRPVRNSPEFMPLDNSLNNDIQQSMSFHCAITAHLPTDDERKFSMDTPNTIASGIKQLVNPVTGNVPSPKRIIQDVDKALRAFKSVYEHKGKMVPGLANRTGHRIVQLVETEQGGEFYV